VGPAIAADRSPGIAGVTPDELAAWLADHDLPSYRGRQVLDAVWRPPAPSLDQVTTLPGPLRAELGMAFTWDTLAATELTVTDGGRT